MISFDRRDGRPLRIGHHGAATLAPENTLESFRKAVETGVDLIEFDVLDLRTGDLVIAHSDDLAEVSHDVASGSVRDRSLESLRAVCPGMPTLDEALAFFVEEAREIGLHLDLKVRGTEDAVVAALRRFDLEDRSFVSSFHFRTIRRVAEIAPRIRAGITVPRGVLGIRESGRGAPVARIGLGFLRRVTPLASPIALSAANATVLVLHHSLADKAAVRRAHDRGAAVVTWTVDDGEALARVDAAGVDAVVTNDPRIFTSTLQP